MQHFVNQNVFFQPLPSAFMCEDVDKMCAVNLTNDSPSKRHQVIKVMNMFRSCFWVLDKLQLFKLIQKVYNLICYFIPFLFFFSNESTC